MPNIKRKQIVYFKNNFKHITLQKHAKSRPLLANLVNYTYRMHRPPQGKVEIGTSCLIHLSTDAALM